MRKEPHILRKGRMKRKRDGRYAGAILESACETQVKESHGEWKECQTRRKFDGVEWGLSKAVLGIKGAAGALRVVGIP